MGRRRSARETALQILYELEFNESGPEEVLRRRKAEKPAGAGAGEYAAWLVRGVFGRRSELDDRIQGAARNWRVARMGLVDRNILRLAVYEMLEEKNARSGHHHQRGRRDRPPLQRRGIGGFRQRRSRRRPAGAFRRSRSKSHIREE